MAVKYPNIQRPDEAPSRYEQQMEDDRRLRMAREMREIAHPAPRRSSISAFSANGIGGFTSYGNDGSVSSFGNFDQPVVGDPDDEMRGAYDNIVGAANLAEGTRRHRARTTLASMYGQALKNGGMVPKSLAPALRKELGQPGLVGGTVAKDGTFMLLGDDGRGGIAPMGLIPPGEVMRAAVESRDADTADALFATYMRDRLTPEQIASYGYTSDWSAKTRQGKAVERNSLAQQKVQNDSLKLFVDLWNKDRGQIPSIDKFLSSLPNGYLEVVTAGDYERDKDGNLIPDEKNGGYLRKQLSPAEMADKAGEFYDRLVQKAQGMGGGGDDPFKSEILNLIRQQMAPQRPAVDTREQEIADLRMNRAVDAERRRDIMSRPQQLVYYKTADGNFASGNGWTRDGKVYDAEGREIAGAIPTDRNGAELPESAEARTRAAQASVLPAAADLGGPTREAAAALNGQPLKQWTDPDGNVFDIIYDENGKPVGRRPATTAVREPAPPMNMSVRPAEDEDSQIADENSGHDPYLEARARRRAGANAEETEEEALARHERQLDAAAQRAQYKKLRRQRQAEADAARAEEAKKPGNAPLSQTRIADLPEAVAKKLWRGAGNAAMAAGESVERGADYVGGKISEGLGAVSAGIGKMVQGIREQGRDMANITPSEIFANGAKELAGYKDALKSIVAMGREKAIPAIRRMLEDNGVDASEVTPGSDVGNAVFDNILKLTSPAHAFQDAQKRGKK